MSMFLFTRQNRKVSEYRPPVKKEGTGILPQPKLHFNYHYVLPSQVTLAFLTRQYDNIAVIKLIQYVYFANFLQVTKPYHIDALYSYCNT